MNAALKTAQAMAAAGKMQEAEDILKKEVARDPACGPALYRLGIFAAQREETETAADYFSRALALAPEAPEVLLSLAAIRLEQGDNDAAGKLAAKAGKLTNSILTLHRLGGIYRQAGQLDLARETYEKILRLQPEHIPSYYGLRSTGKFGAGDLHFASLKKLAENPGRFSVDDQSAMAFTLGRGYLDEGDDVLAFQYFAEANRLKKSLVSPFDAARFDAYIDSVIRLFDDALVKKLSGQGNDNPRPVFILGMPRSGSTLADQIISSHPDASSIGESRHFQRGIPFFPNAEVPGLFSKGNPSITKALTEILSASTLNDIAAKYLSRTDAPAKGVSRLVDKMLPNYLWTGLIRLALPNAKIIHSTRDPRDIALSLWQLSFPAGMQWTYDLGDIGRYYLSYKKLMAHWDALFPGVIYEASYEAMVAEQEAETRRLVAYCGLPFDERCLAFHENARLVKTSSAAQVRQPVYKGSVGKWKQYEKHLAPLLQILDR